MSYTDWKFDPAECKRRIDATIKVLTILRDEGVFTHVVVSGSSGVTMLGALTMAGFNTVMVRKEGESTHGYEIEPILLPHEAKWVFVDDFIASGSTVRRVRRAIEQLFPSWKFNGVLEHDGEYNSTSQAMPRESLQTVTYGLGYRGRIHGPKPKPDQNALEFMRYTDMTFIGEGLKDMVPTALNYNMT